MLNCYLSNMKQICLFILLMIVISDGAAQISGTVQDSKTGKPLEGVEVFVNRSTLASRSDQKGFFQLVINTVSDDIAISDGYEIRRASLERKTPYYTVLSSAWCMLQAIESLKLQKIEIMTL